MTEAVGHCKEGFPGLRRNDCDFMRVGEIIFSIPVGYPVRETLAHSVSWVFVRQLLQGSMQENIKLHEEFFPQPRCNVEEEVQDNALTVKDMMGTIVVSAIFLVIAVMIFLGEIALATFAPSLFKEAVRYSGEQSIGSFSVNTATALPVRRRWMRRVMLQRGVQGKEMTAKAGVVPSNSGVSDVTFQTSV